MITITNLHLHVTIAETSKLDEIITLLNRLEGKVNKAMATLDDALAEVQRQGTIEDSMEALLKTIEAQVIAAGGDTAKIQAVFDGLKANNDRAAAAIVANTPAAPPTA